MVKLHVEPAGLLLLALAVYLGKPSELTVVLIPVVVHETGHVLTLLLLGFRITEIRLELKGLFIGYSGFGRPAFHILAAVAGPLSGFLYAYIASRLALALDLNALNLSAGISLWLSLFNMLPAMPLDGGRILLLAAVEALGDLAGERLSYGISLATGGALLIAGVIYIVGGGGYALALAAFWILAAGLSRQCRFVNDVLQRQEKKKEPV